MDHFTLTLIVVATEIVIVPWCVFITSKHFEHDRKIAVLNSQKDEITKKWDDVKEEMKELKKHIDDRFDKIMDRLNG